MSSRDVKMSCPVYRGNSHNSCLVAAVPALLALIKNRLGQSVFLFIRQLCIKSDKVILPFFHDDAEELRTLFQ